MSIRPLWFVVAAVALATAACASAPPYAGTPPSEATAGPDDPRNARLAEIATTAPGSSGETQGHHIGADDLIQVTIFDAPEMSGSLRVSSEGEVTLPLIGAVPAAGHSPETLARALEDRLRGRFMVDPQVTVQVVEVNSRPVSVLGSVRQPGLLHVRGSRSLPEVLAMAGGLTPDAGETVRITRAAPRDGQHGTIEVNLEQLLESTGANGRTVFVHPGDAVSVEQAGVVYVVGEVGKAGAFPLRGGGQLTALQAIALGGGLNRTASRRQVLVVRTDADGTRTTIPLNITGAMRGTSPDLKLQANDVVYVPNSTGRMISLGAIDTLVRVVTFRPVF